jgi:hypothetical protein
MEDSIYNEDYFEIGKEGLSPLLPSSILEVLGRGFGGEHFFRRVSPKIDSI